MKELDPFPMESLIANNFFSMNTPPDLHDPDDFIDFSFGNPSPSTFPLQEIIRASSKAINYNSLEYCANRGGDQMRSALVQFLEDWRNIKNSKDALIITNGAMEAVSLTAHTFLNKGDVVFVEEPTYYRASHIFRIFGAELHSIPIEHDGLDVNQLSDRLNLLNNLGKHPKMLYTIPNYQNPTGTVLSLDKRKAILELSYKHGFLILEDDVYSDLSYEGVTPASFYTLGATSQISFSWITFKDYLPRHISWMGGRPY